MNAKGAFRSLVLVEVVLSVVVLPLTVAVSSPLPRDLARYLEAMPSIQINTPLAWLLPLLEVVVLLGLFFFVRGARELYVAMNGVSLAQTLYEGVAAVLPSTTYVAVQVERMVTGLIIGLAYRSPVADLLSIGRTEDRQGGRTADLTGGDAVDEANEVRDG